MNKTLYIFILFILLIPSVSAETYRVFVDKEFGFFGVRSNNSTEIINYSDKILYIDIGDKIEWENSVASDERATIISNNKLWNDTDAILGWRTKTFGYTFNKSGTYTVHIKENAIFRTPENFTEVINTSLWFKYQTRIPVRSQKIIVGKSVQQTPTILQKKNKIIASIATKSEEIEDYENYEEFVPQTTIIPDKSISHYGKYTILELIKSIFNKT
jgi:hypothetical protein